MLPFGSAARRLRTGVGGLRLVLLSLSLSLLVYCLVSSHVRHTLAVDTGVRMGVRRSQTKSKLVSMRARARADVEMFRAERVVVTQEHWLPMRLEEENLKKSFRKDQRNGIHCSREGGGTTSLDEDARVASSGWKLITVPSPNSLGGLALY